MAVENVVLCLAANFLNQKEEKGPRGEEAGDEDNDGHY